MSKIEIKQQSTLTENQKLNRKGNIEEQTFKPENFSGSKNTQSKYYLNLLHTNKITPLDFAYINTANKNDPQEEKIRYLNRVGHPDLNDTFPQRFGGYALPNFILDMLDESESINSLKDPYSDLKEEIKLAIKDKDLIAIPHLHDVNYLRQINEIIDTTCEENPDKKIILALEMINNPENDKFIKVAEKIGKLQAQLDLNLLEGEEKTNAENKLAEISKIDIKIINFVAGIIKNVEKKRLQGTNIDISYIDKASTYLKAPHPLVDSKFNSMSLQNLSKKTKKDINLQDLITSLNQSHIESYQRHVYTLKHRNLLQVADISSLKNKSPESVIIYIHGAAHEDTIPILNNLNKDENSVVIPVEHSDDSGQKFSTNIQSRRQDTPYANKLQNLYKNLFQAIPAIRVGSKEIDANEILTKENSDIQWGLFEKTLKSKYNSANKDTAIFAILEDAISESLTKIVRENKSTYNEPSKGGIFNKFFKLF